MIGQQDGAGRVVVTGGSGRVGRYVVRLLRQRVEVINADIVPGERDDEYVHCDVLDLDVVRAVVEGADAICHLAGLDYDVHARPEEFVRVNTLGSWNVLQAAAESNVPSVVLASSSSVYGLLDAGPPWTPLYLPVDELHERRPVEAYSVSKLMIEEMGRAWARAASMSVIAFRPLNVVMVETLDEFLDFVEHAPPSWLYNYVAAEDVARAFALAIDRREPGFIELLLGAADTAQAEPTLQWYVEQVGPLPELRDPGLYRSQPRASIFASNKAREVLGWEPAVNLQMLRARARDETVP